MATYIILISALAILILLFGHSGRPVRGNWTRITNESMEDQYARVYRSKNGK